MAKRNPNAAARGRDDGRKQILLYLGEDVILSLKKLALSEGTTAYELAEEAIKALLEKRRSKR